MKISKKSEYALRALTCLGAPGAPEVLPIQEIARRERIPKKFLEQVLLALKRAGIVHSTRGKAGGYTLVGDPQAISLQEVVWAVDGPLAPLPCVEDANPVTCADCVSLEYCWLRSIMLEVGASIASAFARVSVAEMCKRAEASRRRGSHVAMYDI